MIQTLTSYVKFLVLFGSDPDQSGGPNRRLKIFPKILLQILGTKELSCVLGD